MEHLPEGFRIPGTDRELDSTAQMAGVVRDLFYVIHIDDDSP